MNPCLLLAVRDHCAQRCLWRTMSLGFLSMCPERVCLLGCRLCDTHGIALVPLELTGPQAGLTRIRKDVMGLTRDCGQCAHTVIVHHSRCSSPPAVHSSLSQNELGPIPPLKVPSTPLELASGSHRSFSSSQMSHCSP